MSEQAPRSAKPTPSSSQPAAPPTPPPRQIPRRPPVSSQPPPPSARPAPAAAPRRPPPVAAPPPRPAPQRGQAAPPPAPYRSTAPYRPGTRSSSRYQPPPPSTDRLPLIVGGIVLSILVVLGGFYLATRNTGGGSGSAPPTVASGSVPPTSAAAVTLSTMAPGAGATDPTVAVVAGPTSIPGEISAAFPDRGHTSDPITYKEVPPMGGPHWDVWMNCGIYDQPIQNERGVHSLEHGAVWITYQPNLASDQVAILRAIIRQSGYRLLSPYPNLPHPIVASAWGYQLPLDRADDPRLMQFITRHQQDPAGPEPGASCSDGFGTPIP